MTHIRDTSNVKIVPRTVARFAVIQALFCALEKQETWTQIVQNFLDNRFESKGYDLFGEGPLFIDLDLFKHLTTCWEAEEKDTLDAILAPFLPPNWSVDRMEPTLHALLLCAILEIRHCPETPKRVLINEYVLAAQSFLQGAGMVNAILDKIYETLHSQASSE